MHPNNQRAGNSCRPALTLVEVLVALALGALVLIAVQRALIHIRATVQKIESEHRADAIGELPLRLLDQDLASRPLGSGFELIESRLSFATLNAMQSARVAARHAVAVEHRWEQSGEGWQWARSEQELGASVAGSRVPLASALREVTVDIFDGQTWHSRWPLSTPRAALAIRARYVDRTGAAHGQILPVQPLAWRRHDE